MLTLSYFIFVLVHYFSNQSQEIHQSIAIENIQSQLNSSNQENQVQSSELTQAHLLIQALQQKLNDSNEYSQERRVSLQRYFQNFTQILEYQINNSDYRISDLHTFLQHHIQVLQHLNDSNQDHFGQLGSNILALEQQLNDSNHKIHSSLQNNSNTLEQKMNNSNQLIQAQLIQFQNQLLYFKQQQNSSNKQNRDELERFLQISLHLLEQNFKQLSGNS